MVQIRQTSQVINKDKNNRLLTEICTGNKQTENNSLRFYDKRGNTLTKKAADEVMPEVI